MNLLRIRCLFVAALALGGVGCESLEQSKEQSIPDPDNHWLNTCNEFKAQVAGVDEEIRLRLWRIYDVKWKGKVFGGVGPALIDQMRKDEEAIIQARAKRAASEYRASNFLPPPQTQGRCAVNPDEWDSYVVRSLGCIRPVRAQNADGYVLDLSACPDEQKK